MSEIPSAVLIRMRVEEKKTRKHWQQVGDKFPDQTTITLSVVSTSEVKDPNFPYSFFSSGTTFPLMTINESAAAMFELGKDYMIAITPVVPGE
jgi:hypothetical protein